jgi:hypothetical protein
MEKINSSGSNQRTQKMEIKKVSKKILRLFSFFILTNISQSFAQSGAALNFDGVDDRIDLGTTIGNFGTGNYTVETWFKSTTTGDKTIFGKRVSCNSGSFWNLRLINGALYFEVYGTANVSAISPLATYNDGNWHHVACVRNNNTYTLYVDGAQKAQNVTGVGLAAPYNFTNAASLYIGSGPCGFFPGSVDETRIWNVARTSYEIQQTYNCEIATNATGLLVNLHYNQGTAAGSNIAITNVTDASGNNNNATINNMALTGASSNFIASGAVTSGTSCAAIAAQNFQLNGNGSQDWQGGNCYKLTADQQAAFGSMWYKQKVDLSQDFDMSANLNFGTNNSPGADGITFAFQNVCTSAGTAGQDIGVGGVNPSFVVEFDTYQNTVYSDPSYDHVAIQKNGILNHGSASQLVAPVQIDPTNVNVENGTDYLVRINWISSTKVLEVYVNGNLRTSYTGDIVAQIFSGSPYVYWGFTAATGGESNLQKVCVVTLPTNIVNLASSATICQGASYQANIPGYTTYSWTPTIGVSNPAIGNPTLSPTSNTTYTLAVTDACGNVQTQTIAINVTPLPTIAATGSATICAGSQTQLNATGATSYTWSPAGSLSNAAIANPIATPTSTTTYTVTGTSNSCSNTATVTVTTVPGPIINATGSAAICAGASTQLNATQTGGTGFTWTPSTGLSATNIANPVASPTSTTTYTVSTTNGTCTATSTVTITVNPIPTVTVNAPPSCSGSSVNVTANVTPSGGTYLWSNGLTTSSINVSPSTNTTYSVVYTANGCSNSGSGTVNVNTAPIAVATGTASICQGASTQLNASGGTSYSWTPSVGLSSATVANPMANPNTTTTYIATVTNAAGCTDTAAVTVVITPITASVTASSTSLSCGASANLTATGGSTYLWSPASGLSATNIANPVATPNSTTTYTVTVTNGACTATNNITIDVNSLSVSAGNDVTVCVGANTQLNASLAGSGYYTNIATGYAFTQFNNAYSSITGGTVFLDNASPTMDDVVSGAITIPAFIFNNVTYTSIYISTNGFITFGSAPTATNYTPISSNESYAGCVAAFAQDLGAFSSFNSEIRYKLQGTDFIIQWKNFGRYDGSSVDEELSFQIVLDVANNKVGIIYSNVIWSGSSTAYPQVGIRGANNNFATNVNNRTVASTANGWINSTAGTSNTSTCYIDFSVEPNNGLTYLWTPSTFYTATYAWSPTTGLNNPNIANPIATPATTTDYTVTMTYGASCTATETVNVNVVVCTGIDELSNINDLIVYPNPTSSLIYILNTQNKFIEITAVNGNLVYSNKSTKKQEEINLEAFAKGIYFIKVTDADGVKVKKIIKD